MTLKSLFDEKRRREIREGIARGRLELRKARDRNTRLEEPQTILVEKRGQPPAPAPDAGQVSAPRWRDVDTVLFRLDKLREEMKPPKPPQEEPEEPREFVRKIKSEFGAEAKEFQNKALVAGIISGRLEQVKHACESGADINMDTTASGICFADGHPCRTPLQIARNMAKEEIERYLRKHGAKE